MHLDNAIGVDDVEGAAVGAAVGAGVGYAVGESLPHVVLAAIEGVAAGAMLTAIAESMLPEAFEQGGAIVGFSTLLGFIAGLLVKLI